MISIGQLKAIITDTKDISIAVKSAGNADLGKLKDIKGVETVSLQDNTIKINSDAGVSNLNEIIEHLITSGVQIRCFLCKDFKTL